MLKGPAKIGILGPAYSVAAYPVAQLASLYQVPQVNICLSLLIFYYYETQNHFSREEKRREEKRREEKRREEKRREEKRREEKRREGKQMEGKRGEGRRRREKERKR